MSDFVEQCRSEWKRLGVPDPLAEEMAADLTADLADAQAEGVSAEELLGSSVFDPRAFAASWAAERGVVPPAGRAKSRRRPLVLVAFTAVAALTLIVATLLLATGEPKVSLVATRAAAPRVAPLPPGPVLPPGTTRQVVLSANTSAPIEWILLVLAVVALGFAAWLWAGWGRTRPPAAPA
jgi:hypothetical protein